MDPLWPFAFRVVASSLLLTFALATSWRQSKADPLFGPSSLLEAGDRSSYVELEDANGDGHLDVFVANSGSNSVTWWLGRGDVTFGRRNDVVVPGQPRGLAVGDVDGDGLADLVIPSSLPEDHDQISILRGAGDGSFAPWIDL